METATAAEKDMLQTVQAIKTLWGRFKATKGDKVAQYKEELAIVREGGNRINEFRNSMKKKGWFDKLIGLGQFDMSKATAYLWSDIAEMWGELEPWIDGEIENLEPGENPPGVKACREKCKRIRAAAGTGRPGSGRKAKDKTPTPTVDTNKPTIVLANPPALILPHQQPQEAHQEANDNQPDQTPVYEPKAYCYPQFIVSGKIGLPPGIANAEEFIAQCKGGGTNLAGLVTISGEGWELTLEEATTSIFIATDTPKQVKKGGK